MLYKSLTSNPVLVTIKVACNYLPALFAALPLLVSTVTVNAASVSLVPTAATQNVVDGDIVSFDIHMDFSDNPTIGGGFNILFDPSALGFVSFFRDETIGDPDFSRDPDVIDGALENWGVADIDGLPDIAILGNVVFQVLPTMGQSTQLGLQGSGICGCFTGTDFMTIIHPHFGEASVSRVPLPATSWLMLSALAFLFGFRRARAHRGL